MTSKKKLALPLLIVGALAACSDANTHPTRLKAEPLAFGARGTEALEANLQAESLTRLADEMVMRSTGRGAKTGAAIGCGLGLISASSAKRCVAGAVAGAVAGGAIGYEVGKRQVRQRLQKVSAEEMAFSLRENSDKIDEINSSLPKFLAAQDAELTAINSAKTEGKISQDEYEKRVAQIRAQRAVLAAALTESARKANQSAQNLGAASASGQPGLMWHIGEAMRIEEEATLARAQIKLF